MAVKFKDRTLQGTLSLFPGVSVAFEDPQAEDYFVAAGFADKTEDPPVATYPVGSIEIDPSTVHASTGKLVLEAQGASTTVENVPQVAEPAAEPAVEPTYAPTTAPTEEASHG